MMFEAAQKTMKLTPISPRTQLRRPCVQKVVVILGCTGTGKTKLSIDIATRFKGEVINSDIVQVFKGLDITTNKITEKERCDVQHHLLGILDPKVLNFSVKKFFNMVSEATESIVGRGKLPIIAGGTISVIESLVKDKKFQSRYTVCFLWVDADMQVLENFVDDRVDRMVQEGMVEEVGNMYIPNANYKKGIWRAIGVAELDSYFREQNQNNRDTLLESAIEKTKIETRKLAHSQISTIIKLRDANDLKMHRLDATEVLREKGKEADKAWEELVAKPASKIVEDFLKEIDCYPDLAATAA